MISIVLTGPESVGKSILTKELAKHFQGYSVDEYAREYVENIAGQYTFEDVENIAKFQVESFKRMNARSEVNKPVFFDTYLFITKVWFQEVFNCCPVWVHEAIKSTKINFALLCFPDLPWEADGVRENPHRREYLFNCYLQELEYYNVPYATVTGYGRSRLKNAVHLIRKKTILP
jgi:nicotinamide riboside kinase